MADSAFGGVSSLFSNISNIASAFVAPKQLNLPDVRELIQNLENYPNEQEVDSTTKNSVELLLTQFDVQLKSETYKLQNPWIDHDVTSETDPSLPKKPQTILLDTIPHLLVSVQNFSIFSHIASLFKVRGSLSLSLSPQDTSNQNSITPLTIPLNSQFFHNLLSLLEKHSNSISHLSLLFDIFVHMAENQLKTIQSLFQQEPIHISKFLDFLSGSTAEFISHSIIYFLSLLSTDFPLLQKLIVFENGFELIFPIIESEDGLNGNSMIVSDALTLMHNLLSSNTTTRKYFIETKECISPFIHLFLNSDPFSKLLKYSKQSLATWCSIFWFLTITGPLPLHYAIYPTSQSKPQIDTDTDTNIDNDESEPNIALKMISFSIPRKTQDLLFEKLVKLTFSGIHFSWIPFLLDLLIHFDSLYVASTVEKLLGPSIWTHLMGHAITCSNPDIRTTSHHFICHCLEQNTPLQIRLFSFQNTPLPGEAITSLINSFMDSLYTDTDTDTDTLNENYTDTHSETLKQSKQSNIYNDIPPSDDPNTSVPGEQPPPSLFGYIRKSISVQAFDSFQDSFVDSFKLPNLSNLSHLSGHQFSIPEFSNKDPTDLNNNNNNYNNIPLPSEPQILNDNPDHKIGTTELIGTIFVKFSPAQILFSSIFVNTQFWSNILDLDYSMVISTTFHISQAISILTNAFSSTQNKTLRLELLSLFQPFSVLLEQCSSALRTLLANVVMRDSTNPMNISADGSMGGVSNRISSVSVSETSKTSPHSASRRSQTSQKSPANAYSLSPFESLEHPEHIPSQNSSPKARPKLYLDSDSSSLLRPASTFSAHDSHIDSNSSRSPSDLDSSKYKSSFNPLNVTSVASGFQKLASLVSSSAVGALEAAKNTQKSKSIFDTSCWPISWTLTLPKSNSEHYRSNSNPPMTIDSRCLALSTLQNGILQLFAAWISNCPEAIKMLVSDTNLSSQLLVLVTEKVGVGFSPSTAAFILLELLTMGISACESDSHLARELTSINTISASLGGAEFLQNIVSSFSFTWKSYYNDTTMTTVDNASIASDIYPPFEISSTSFENMNPKPQPKTGDGTTNNIDKTPNSKTNKNLFYFMDIKNPDASSILPGFILTNLFKFATPESLLFGLEHLDSIDFQSWLHNVLDSFSKPTIVPPPLISHSSIHIHTPYKHNSMISISGFHKFWASTAPLLGDRLANDATLSSLTKSIDMVPHLTELYLEQQAELSHCYFVISELEKYVKYLGMATNYLQNQ